MQIEENKLKRFRRTALIALIASSASFTIVMRNSHIRTVEVISLLAIGMSIGLLLANFAFHRIIKK